MTEYEEQLMRKCAVLRAAVDRLLAMIREEVLGPVADGQMHGGPHRVARIRRTVEEVRESIA